MNYILKRHSDGRYVARSGSTSSYTKDLREARRFPTREAAAAEACDNESVVTIESELNS